MKRAKGVGRKRGNGRDEPALRVLKSMQRHVVNQQSECRARSSQCDLMVITFCAGVFGFRRPYYKLYTFGRDLDPKAPVTVEPFTPVMWGKKQIANFLTEANPSLVLRGELSGRARSMDHDSPIEPLGMLVACRSV